MTRLPRPARTVRSASRPAWERLRVASHHQTTPPAKPQPLLLVWWRHPEPRRPPRLQPPEVHSAPRLIEGVRQHRTIRESPPLSQPRSSASCDAREPFVLASLQLSLRFHLSAHLRARWTLGTPSITVYVSRHRGARGPIQNTGIRSQQGNASRTEARCLNRQEGESGYSLRRRLSC